MKDLAWIWAVVGVAAVFVEAIVQLARRGIATMSGGLEPFEWLALVALTIAFVWGEGLRALAQRWVPAVMRRARELRGERTIWRVLAPLYAMMLVGADRGTLARAWVGVALIFAAVLFVRAMPEPWRGIIDFAVALALAVGLGAMVRLAVRAEG